MARALQNNLDELTDQLNFDKEKLTEDEKKFIQGITETGIAIISDQLRSDDIQKLYDYMLRTYNIKADHLQDIQDEKRMLDKLDELSPQKEQIVSQFLSVLERNNLTINGLLASIFK